MLSKENISTHFLELKALNNNPAHVPSNRMIKVMIPPVSPAPSLYILAPWTQAGRSAFDWRPFKESIQDRLNRLFQQGKISQIPYVISVDLFTDYGGSQYIDSSYFGGHGSCFIEDVFPFIEKHFDVKKGVNHRGVFGRSSGGFGALRLAMDFEDSFSAVAAHSADLDFELMFKGDLVTLCNKLSRYDYSVEKFLDYCRKSPKIESGDIHVLMLLGSAGFYSPNKLGGYDIPIDLKKGVINESVWCRWKEHDPLSKIEVNRTRLSNLKLLYVECGLRDQYNLLYGARQLHEKLCHYEIDHFYEEFPDNHSGTEYRFDISLPKMLHVLQ